MVGERLRDYRSFRDGIEQLVGSARRAVVDGGEYDDPAVLDQQLDVAMSRLLSDVIELGGPVGGEVLEGMP